MKDIYFVLLHYQVKKETKDCISSIRSSFGNDIKIVIVDNASPNKSGNELKSYYEADSNVTVLINDKNLGFAKGNNVGYQYAKEHGARFIIQANNDTIFEDTGFINEMIQIYDEEHYAVLGPDVISTEDGLHQNPAYSFVQSKKNIKKQLLKAKVGLLLNTVNLDLAVKKAVNVKKSFNNYLSNEKYYLTKNDNVLLHGSCWIFSPEYIKNFDGLFDGTFMYYEEDILKFQCLKMDLKMMYSPTLRMLHRRKSATSIATGSERLKRRFFYKNSINSLKAYLDFYEKR